jgi:hypothetical protein
MVAQGKSLDEIKTSAIPPPRRRQTSMAHRLRLRLTEVIYKEVPKKS